VIATSDSSVYQTCNLEISPKGKNETEFNRSRFVSVSGAVLVVLNGGSSAC